MKALISPIEACELGFRIVQVGNDTFEVSEPLFWIECPEYIEADLYYYKLTDNSFVEVSKQFTENPPPSEQPVTTGAQTL